MALSKFGFIVTGAGLDPAEHRLEMAAAAFTMIVVGVAEPVQALPVAAALADAGVELLELCGGFGPVWTGRIIDHLAGRIPVGAVGYGPEATTALHRLFNA